MRRIGILTALILLALFATSCTRHWGNLKTISNKVPADREAFGDKVTGEHCKFLVDFLGLVDWPSIELASQDAISKAPDAVGLKDANINLKQALLVNYKCFVVTGTPVKVKK